MDNTNKKIAILIDGDNAESNLIEKYISEAGRYGRVTVKRIYADWTDNKMKGWKEQLNKYAVRPIQKFSYTTGKNSTDTALIIDAMDLLHQKLIDGICIVSSDSDYTGISHRIREEGLFIMGIGKSHTPESFRKSCEIFIFSEILQSNDVISKENNAASKNEVEKVDVHSGNPKMQFPKILGKIDLEPISSLKKSGIKSINTKQIDDAFQMVVEVDTGLALLSRFSEALRKIDPTFDYRNYGYISFKKFCESLAPKYQIVHHNDKKTLSLKKNE